MLLSTFGRKHVSKKRNCESWFWNKKGKEIVKAVSTKELEELVMEAKWILMLPHPLTNFEIWKYYQNESRFNGVYSRHNLAGKLKDGAYVVSLDEYADVGTQRIALFSNRSEIVYFNSFGVEYVPEEIKEFIEKKNIKANIFRVQANNSVMCGYFCIGFIDFMLAGKTLVEFTSMFSPYDFEKNKSIILGYLKNE